MAKQIGVIGSGAVGQALANGFLKHGYSVMRGSREPTKLADWRGSAGAKASTGTMAETARFGEIVVLAVKGAGALEAVKACGPDALAGKPVFDTTNPLDDKKTPAKGIVPYFTDLNESLMEKLQASAPQAQFVKIFSCVGNGVMVNPDFGGVRPTMFICGNAESAKAEARKVLEQFGWDAEDLGSAEAARAIEPLCMLWCIPGFLHGQWGHAFKLLKPGAQSA